MNTYREFVNVLLSYRLSKNNFYLLGKETVAGSYSEEKE